MKKGLITIFGILIAMLSVTFQAEAQRSIVPTSTTNVSAIDVDLGDSLIFNLGAKQDVHKWSGFKIEVLYESMTVNDTTAAVELYAVLNGDYSDATNLDTGDALVGADGAGGTGTIMRTLTVSSFNSDNLRIVIDPDEDDSGSATATIRIVPTYKTGYSPPN